MKGVIELSCVEPICRLLQIELTELAEGCDWEFIALYFKNIGSWVQDEFRKEKQIILRRLVGTWIFLTSVYLFFGFFPYQYQNLC